MRNFPSEIDGKFRVSDFDHAVPIDLISEVDS